MISRFDILHEDNDILVCIKPAGVAAGSEKSGAMDMLSMVLNYLARKDRSKAPEAYLIHRLDKPVSGVIVFAKNKQAAAKLSAQFANHLCGKRYFCIVTDAREKEGTLVSYIREDKRSNVASLTGSEDKEAKRAELVFKELEEKEIDGKRCSLMDIELKTGRHHQIRLQMTEVSDGIYGDTKYNKAFGENKGFTQLALFSYELTIKHPYTGKIMTFNAKPTQEIFGEFTAI
ncbi:MAG: RluA family pseudouridine synthase [Lachnospiraceae bacterium]|nr:RluA family pseudouridine synthase [Lachnospiraceae bacterium]